MLDRRAVVKGIAVAPLLYATTRSAPARETLQHLDPPDGPTILTVSGSIERVNAGDACKFDRPMLESLGTTALRTSTAWTADAPLFEGVPARDLLDAVGADGREVVAGALNDYTVTIPLAELYRYPVLLALKMNGEYLKIRNKGPIWLVYPRDQYPELNNSLTDKKWVWQLSHLKVR